MTKQILKIFIFAVFFLGTAVVIYLGQKYYFLRSPTQLEVWNQYDDQNRDVVDHALWQRILDTYLVVDNKTGLSLFRYGAVSPKDNKVLDRYLSEMSQVDPREYNRAEQMAYWLNLYNALTIDVVLKSYPVDSIKDIGEGIPGRGPWDDKAIEVVEQDLTLNDIEHRILRAIWQDGRVHYGLNCASIGCPNLYHKVFRGESVDEQLDAAGRQFVAHSRGVRFKENKLVLSSIYNWFSPDFGNNQSEVLQHISQFAEGSLRAELMKYEGEVSYEYDWRINEFPGQPVGKNHE